MGLVYYRGGKVVRYKDTMKENEDAMVIVLQDDT